jgi:methionine sulfoxide reductase heme-binding subunit
MIKALRKNLLRICLHLLSLIPATWLGWQVWLWVNFAAHDLTANPIEYITDFTGGWTIRFLLITLSISPLSRLTKWSLLKYRRLFGLYAFLYGLLHFLNYMVLDYYFDWPLIIEDIFKRPAISFGMMAFCLLIPLAVTSFKFVIKKMAKSWQTLHQLIYLLTIFAVIHNYMMVKADVLVPIIHGIILSFLLGYRIITRWNKQKSIFKKQLAWDNIQQK